MSYRGSEAERLDYIERPWEYEETRPHFDVVEGGGAAIRARQDAAAQFNIMVRLAVVAIVTFVIVGIVRVSITSATVSHLCANVDLQSKISDAEDLNASLRVERSVLSNSTRIVRIATENYGMVHASEHDHLALSAAAVAAENADGAEAAGAAAGLTTAGSVVSKTADSGARVAIEIQNAAANIAAQD